MKFLLSSIYIRRWVASWVIKWMSSKEFYKPATLAAPILTTWLLDDLKKISLEQLRRLTLAALMHWLDISRYYGENFTTIPSKSTGMRYGFDLLFLFAIYNTLSNNHPLREVGEYIKQIGGLPPLQADPVGYLVNYVTGNQSLKLRLSVDQPMYEFGQSVNVSLEMENLIDEPIIVNNTHGPSVKFLAEAVTTGSIQEEVYQLAIAKNKMDEQIILSPGVPITINWLANLLERSSYLIKAEVYAPRYEKVVELVVGIEYGVKPTLVKMSTEYFCTL